MTARLKERLQDELEDKVDYYTDELASLIEAAFTVVARTGSLDPPVREILREAGLSNQAFYRHVESKDELLLLMLDQGRRSLVRYLDHQMLDCPDAAARIRVWIGGVLAQARDVDVARRTRPFLAQADRLAELFPEEQRRSEDLLIAQIAQASAVPVQIGTVVYDLAFGALGRHLRRGTTPKDLEIEALTALAVRLVQEEGEEDHD